MAKKNISVGQCVITKKFVSIKKMNDDQKLIFDRLGKIVSADYVDEFISSLSDTDRMLMYFPAFKSELKAKHKALVAKRKKELAERRANRPISAFKRVVNLLTNAKLTNSQVKLLQDKKFVLNTTHIIYPILRPVEDGNLIISNKARYSNKKVSILGKDYFVTNHVYNHNVEMFAKLMEMFTQFSTAA